MSDLNGLWMTFQRHSHKIGLLIAGLALFIGGWMSGRAMSPYYASHPIVFSGDTSQSCVSVGGSPEALSSLRTEGLALKESPSAPVATVASAQTVQPDASPTLVNAKTFVGSKNSDKYHDPSCASAKRIKEENQVWFASRGEAEKAGYTPSECTKEKLGI